jgi:hypothetical protein
MISAHTTRSLLDIVALTQQPSMHPDPDFSSCCLAARSVVFLTGLSPQSLLLSVCAFLLRFGFSTLLIFTLYKNARPPSQIRLYGGEQQQQQEQRGQAASASSRQQAVADQLSA